MSERTKYFRYNGLSHFQQETQVLQLFTDTNRPVQATITINPRQVGAIREALNALMLVLESGFIYRSTTGKGEINYDDRADNKAVSRNRFFTTIRKTDPEAVVGMDPTISISSKGILIEGFALNYQDMGSVFIPASSYTVAGELTTGTSTLEVGPDLQKGLLQVTAKRDLVIRIGSSANGAEEAYTGSVHKDFVYGNRWKREILQFMAASVAPGNVEARFKRIDLYNILRHLRLHKEEKGDSTALRLILINGLNPEIRLEPWNTKVVSPVGPFDGDRSAIMRYYSRDKLVRLQPLLPYIDNVDVSLLGEALPGFWILNSEDVSYTYGTMGFGATNWARGLLRDQMLRRDTANPDDYDTVMSALQTVSNATVSELVSTTGLDTTTVRQSLLRGVQIGQVAPNAGVGGYQYRELFVETSMTGLVYGETFKGYKDETLAYEIVEQGRVDMNGKIHVQPSGAIDFARLYKVKQGHDDSTVQYKSESVKVSQAKRSFQTEDPVFEPKLQLNAIGAVKKPGCTCAYMDAVGKGAICSHLQALWIQYCREHILGQVTGMKSLAQNILVKVDGEASSGHRISIRGRRIIDEWGTIDDLNGGRPERRVRLYQRQEDACTAFVNRIAELEGQGFINAG